jgi:hypothetical protein
MAKKPSPKPEKRTWDGLSDDDVTGADEAEDAMLMEFGRKTKGRNCGKDKDPSSRQAKP